MILPVIASAPIVDAVLYFLAVLEAEVVVYVTARGIESLFFSKESS